jgi:protease I
LRTGGEMGKNTLEGKKVAILVADGFEQEELTGPKEALEAAGAEIQIVSPAEGEVQGWNHDEKADKFRVDMPLNLARSDDYDALLLPGGVRNPDQLRMSTRAVEFLDGFFATGKPVAAICHAPWLLIETEVIKGMTITSWPSLKTDLTNAGAHWVDRDVVVDRGLVTSRKPADIPAFNKKMVEKFAEGRRSRQIAA